MSKDLRARRQSARHRDPLPHAARELRRVAPLEAGKPDQIDEMAGALVAFRLGEPDELQRERHVVDHGSPREGRFLLKDHPDRRMRPRQALARHRHAALITVDQTADHVEQG